LRRLLKRGWGTVESADPILISHIALDALLPHFEYEKFQELYITRLAVVRKWILSRSGCSVLFNATHFAFVLRVWRT
jgi:hypothetical protein